MSQWVALRPCIGHSVEQTQWVEKDQEVERETCWEAGKRQRREIGDDIGCFKINILFFCGILKQYFFNEMTWRTR